MANNLFDILEDEAQGHEKKRATTLAFLRSKTRFSSFLTRAETQGEWQSRMDLINRSIDDVVTAACEEEHCADVSSVNSAVREQIRAKMAPCTHCDCSDCTGEDCGCCDTCDGKNCYEQGKSGRTAADVETGDTYTQEREALPKAGPDGLSDEATVSIDMSPAGDEQHTFQKPIEVPSQRHPNEVQDIENRADYTKTLGEYSDVAERVDADNPMQPEFTNGPNTMVFPNKGQAQPVSARTKKAEMGGPPAPGEYQGQIPPYDVAPEEEPYEEGNIPMGDPGEYADRRDNGRTERADLVYNAAEHVKISLEHLEQQGGSPEELQKLTDLYNQIMTVWQELDSGLDGLQNPMQPNSHHQAGGKWRVQP